MKIGIFYGSTTGTTAEEAKKIARELNVKEMDIHDVAKSAPSAIAPYDLLIFGTSTWGSGDLQDDWYDFIDGLEALSLRGKTVALFGCGDETMSNTFCGAVGVLYDRIQATGATVIGAFNTEGYNYAHSPAEKDGRIVGLLLDDVNHPDLSDERVKTWTSQLISELAR